MACWLPVGGLWDGHLGACLFSAKKPTGDRARLPDYAYVIEVTTGCARRVVELRRLIPGPPERCLYTRAR